LQGNKGNWAVGEGNGKDDHISKRYKKDGLKKVKQ
jgi:hypothetical protein